jgi:hypothetical protein
MNLSPSPKQIIAAREASGLTLAAAAELVYLGAAPRWSEYENGKRSPDPARWELFLLKTGQHPTHKTIARGGPKTKRAAR